MNFVNPQISLALGAVGSIYLCSRHLGVKGVATSTLWGKICRSYELGSKLLIQSLPLLHGPSLITGEDFDHSSYGQAIMVIEQQGKVQ